MDMHFSDRRACAYYGARTPNEVDASARESGPESWKVTTMNEEMLLVSDWESAR